MDLDKKKLIILFLLFFPISFGSYLIHEFGHWIVGEALGNTMHYSLNYVWPKSGQYHSPNHSLYVSIGGPAMTILLSLFSLIILEITKNAYLFPIIFFQFFVRFFSIVFGGFNNQDEARISALLGVGTYTVATIVILILITIVWRASYTLKINLQYNGYFFAMSTLCALIVIASYNIFQI